MSADRTRRQLLLGVAGAAIVSLAGCNTGSESPAETASTDPTTFNSATPDTTEPNSDTELGEFQYSQADVLPIITDETQENQTGFEVEVTDQDGIDGVEVYFNNDSLDEALRVYEEDSRGTEEITVMHEFPQKMVAPGKNLFDIHVTDETGRTQEFTAELTPDTHEWKIDTPHGEYSTERTWDDLNFQKQEMEEQKQEWLQQMTYNDLVEELSQDTERVQEKYKASDHGDTEYPNAEQHGGGHWNTVDFRETNKTQEILKYSNVALQIHALENLQITAWSGENDHFAATHQTLANDLHEENETQRNVETTHVNEGGHGTVIAYADPEKLDNEYTFFDGETHGEFNYWFVDTTNDWVMPINNEETKIPDGVRGSYNPFIEGYHGNRQNSHLDYDREKVKAVGPLVGFGDRSNSEHNIDMRKVSISDPVLENIYNEHVPEGEAADPIIDMVMKSGQKQEETREHVQVYGEDLQYNEEEGVFEGVEYAVNDGTLYEHSMEEGTRVTTEHVHQYLEGEAEG